MSLLVEMPSDFIAEYKALGIINRKGRQCTPCTRSSVLTGNELWRHFQRVLRLKYIVKALNGKTNCEHQPLPQGVND